MQKIAGRGSLIFFGHRRYGLAIIKTSSYKYIISNYRVLNIIFDNKSIYIDFLLKNAEELKSLLTDLYNKGFSIRVIEIFSPKKYFIDLTEKQEKILLAAYIDKYFDDPRGSNLSTLSKKLGISIPTTHEHLRKALYKIVRKYVIENKVI